MKKFLCVLLTIVICAFPLVCFAEKEPADDVAEISISAPAGILIDENGRVLFEKSADTKLDIASVTKIMTLNLVFDAIESGKLTLDEDVTVSDNAASMGGSQAYIDGGYSYKISDLIKSVIIASANDSAVALAETVAGSTETFVSLMNQKAKSLGMNDTCFKNCTGLPEEGHCSTARDVSKMSQELLKHQDYFNWSSTRIDELYHAKDGRKTELVNTNKLLRSLSGCDGLKTGSTSSARYCVSTTAKRGDMRLIAVILGGETSKARFNDAEKLINYGFANYKNVYAEKEAVFVKTNKGILDEVELLPTEKIKLCVRADGTDKIEICDSIPEKVNAPIVQGQEIGQREVYLNGELKATVTLTASQDCAKKTIFDIIKSIFNKNK